MRSSFNKHDATGCSLIALLAVLIIVLALTVAVGQVVVLGVVGFHLYRAYHPAAWPYISQLEWLGISLLFTLFFHPFSNVKVNR